MGVLSLAAIVLGVPLVYYRAAYAEHKRLRCVTPGVFYRSGQMTAQGFEEAVACHGIRTIVNLQDDYPDPDIALSYCGRDTVKESELCRRLGVRYIHIQPDLIPRRQVPMQRPAGIDKMLAVLDNPLSYPVLIHCKAGLHRAGVMTAVYRMEYNGWSKQQAIAELRANGFGDFACTAANDYIKQYILTYKPGVRHGAIAEQVP